MTSAPSSAGSSRSWIDTLPGAPIASRPGASSVRGATMRTRAPILVKAQMFERATRLWRMSPQMTMSSPSSVPLVLADGRAVEQRLRRVLVGAVAGVDHAGAQARGEHLGGARLGVAHDHHVGRHGVEVPRGVEQRLPLHRRGGRARDVDRVGRQPLGGDLERGPRAGRRLEEQVDDRLPPQRRHLLDGALVDLQEPVAEIEQHGDLPGVERLHPQEVPVRETGHARRSRRTTRSPSPRSDSITRTDSLAVVSTTTPTTSGWIGSSRRPRSTSAASLTARGRP